METLAVIALSLLLTYLTMYLEASVLGTTLKEYWNYMTETMKDTMYHTIVTIMMFMLYLIVSTVSLRPIFNSFGI